MSGLHPRWRTYVAPIAAYRNMIRDAFSKETPRIERYTTAALVCSSRYHIGTTGSVGVYAVHADACVDHGRPHDV